MATEYGILWAGIHRVEKYGRQTGEEFPAVRLQIGKRDRLEVIPLTADEALELAWRLIAAARREAALDA